MYRCMLGIFPPQLEIIPWNSRPVTNILMPITLNMIATDTEGADIHLIADRTTLKKERYLCHRLRQVMIPTYLQATGLVTCSRTGLMTVETHQNTVESRCRMNARGSNGNPTWRSDLLLYPKRDSKAGKLAELHGCGISV